MKKYYNLFSLFFLLCLCINTSLSQWKTNGPYCGSITCIASSGNKIYAGTFDSGIFMSSDNGNSWSTNNNFHHLISSINIKDNTIYVGTESGLYTSNDEGNSWSEIKINSNTGNVQLIAFNGDDLYVTHGFDGLFLSSDNEPFCQIPSIISLSERLYLPGP